MDASPPVNRNVFAILLAVSILHLVFAFTVLLIDRLNTLGEIPFSPDADGVMFLSILVQVVLLGVIIYLGLYLGRSVGLGAPLLGSWARGEPAWERAVSALKIALAVGLGVAAAKYLLDLWVFSPFVPATLSQWRQVTLFLRLPIPFQQGIGDEIVYRLFWMTVIIWVTWKVTGRIRRAGDEPPRDVVYWAGIIIAGLIPVLGLVLSRVSGLALLQYAVIILAGAIPFGWLYWKKGIESALVAHFVSGLALVLLSLW
jgi:hypothetical protein